MSLVTSHLEGTKNGRLCVGGGVRTHCFIKPLLGTLQTKLKDRETEVFGPLGF